MRRLLPPWQMPASYKLWPLPTSAVLLVGQRFAPFPSLPLPPLPPLLLLK